MERSLSIQDVERWGYANLEEITSILKSEREIILSFGERKSLNDSSFVLSEMPLCTGVKNIVPPLGCRLIKNWIVFPRNFEEKNGERRSDMHTYFQTFDSKKIVCVVPGQFIILNKDVLPGERISVLKGAVPNLVRIFSDQIAILSGGYDEINEALGIDYKRGLRYVAKGGA